MPLLINYEAECQMYKFNTLKRHRTRKKCRNESTVARVGLHKGDVTFYCANCSTFEASKRYRHSCPDSASDAPRFVDIPVDKVKKRRELMEMGMDDLMDAAVKHNPKLVDRLVRYSLLPFDNYGYKMSFIAILEDLVDIDVSISRNIAQDKIPL